MPLNYFKTSAVITAALGLVFVANGQDWTSGSETLYFEYDIASSQQRVSTDKLREVIQSCDVNSIMVVGHTDSSGNSAYNSALSLRRAESLKKELVAMGISAGAITTRGAGESELAVLTGDGVKEALNRRAEVIFGFSQPCSIYYSQPITTVQPSEIVTYTDPAPVTQATPQTSVVQPAPTPTPVAQVPTPVAQAPVPVTAPPPVPVTAPPPAPVAVGGGAGLTAVAVGAWAVAGAAIIAENDDDDDEPVSP